MITRLKYFLVFSLFFATELCAALNSPIEIKPFVAVTQAVDVEQLARLQQEANVGDAGAQYNLGFIYLKGLGASPDVNMAFDWFKKAAERGFALAQTQLGFSYAEGQGVTKDDSLAFQWYGKAAKQGEPGAQMNLGLIYSDGKIVPKDEKMAFSWFLKSAQQGRTTAQFIVANRYFQGNGVAKQPDLGLTYLEKSANQGFVTAQTELGEMYAKGLLVNRDENKARSLLQRAVDQGDDDAKKWLSFLTLCKAPYHTGGDGHSVANAVILPKAKTSFDGINMENCWLSEKYPSYQKTAQSLVNENRIYDRIEITTRNGKTQIIYFDVTDWIGFRVE